jgi:hypothetical protein
MEANTLLRGMFFAENVILPCEYPAADTCKQPARSSAAVQFIRIKVFRGNLSASSRRI